MPDELLQMDDPQPQQLPPVSPQVEAAARDMLDQMRAIMDAPLPPEDQHAPLTAKRMQRLEAAELRAQWRRAQGRPV